MRKYFLPTICCLVSSLVASAATSTPSPLLQWVKTVSGTGGDQVTAVATDGRGNLYIAGTTASTDFPTTSAAQSAAGGATAVRIGTTSGSSQKLLSPALASATSIAIDPRNPQVLYAAAASSLLHSIDSGNTWTSLPNFPKVSTVNVVAVDPANSSTLYAGTIPLGAFKSTDGGATWAPINTGVPPDSSGTLNVSRIWPDPSSPGVLFAAVSPTSDLLRSSDGGASWKSVFTTFFASLAFDPFAAGTIYANSFLANGAARSMDDGLTWTPLARVPDGGAFFSFVADPFHPATLYAASSTGIYQSADRGATWNTKIHGQPAAIAADPGKPVLYASLAPFGVLMSTDGFTTTSTIGPPVAQVRQLQVDGAQLFVLSSPSTDVFVIKLDANGNVVYSTYFGGSAADSAAGMAVKSDGSVYVTGTTGSADFPVTTGAYATAFPASSSTSNFIFRLNPDGTLGWSTFFADTKTTSSAIALDSGGDPYIAGTTSGGLPTTAGVYQPNFQSVNPCGPGSIGFCPPTTSAFLTKFNPSGSGLVFSTYIPKDTAGNLIQTAGTLTLDAGGDAYLAGPSDIFLMSAAGDALLGITDQRSMNIRALALDAAGNLYAAGTSSSSTANPFPATPGAFQSSPQPAIPALPGSGGSDSAGGGIGDAFVAKFKSDLSQIVAATLLGGEKFDTALNLALDPASGGVIVSGYTDSKAFPMRAPFQGSFSPRSGFAAGLDSGLSQLLFSTYLGDNRPFVARGAVPDGSGNIILAGSTQAPDGSFVSADPGFPFSIGTTVIANKITLPAAPPVRLDSVVNFASQIGVAVAPGEPIAAIGSGFGPDARILLNGTALPTVSASSSRVAAILPDSMPTSGAQLFAVSSGGVTSNPVWMPAAAASPGIYSVDGSGFGQGYILNKDGSINSSSNPANEGDPITIFATGVGLSTLVGPFTVANLPVSVFVDGFYANGIAAQTKQVAGLPGGVYELSVFVPRPADLANPNNDLAGFKMPPEVPILLVIGAVSPLNPVSSNFRSQDGLAFWVN